MRLIKQKESVLWNTFIVYLYRIRLSDTFFVYICRICLSDSFIVYICRIRLSDIFIKYPFYFLYEQIKQHEGKI